MWESNGYPDSVTVPEYRIWSLETFGQFSGSSGERTLPIHLTALKLFSDEVKEHYDRYQYKESVAHTEILLKEHGFKSNIQVSTAHMALEIGTKLYPHYNCVQAWAEYHPSRLVELLNSVRNRVLDFALAVGKEAPNAGEAGSSAHENIEPAKVTQIFYTTVHGGAANIVGAATASPVTFSIGVKDFSALQRVLGEKGVSAEDMSELKTALEADPAPSAPEKFGLHVSSWIGKMVTKAVTGGWQITAGAAGKLLADAITKYYGF